MAVLNIAEVRHFICTEIIVYRENICEFLIFTDKQLDYVVTLIHLSI